jgi:hypothetical protein
MKPVIRYQSQLLYRRSYKPNRVLRIKPSLKLRFNFRPIRFGGKPVLTNMTSSADPTPRRTD